MSSAYLIETLDRARELAADFVVFTGDFVTYRSANVTRELARVLRHLPNRHIGTVGVLGNHDYGWREWRQVEVGDQISQIAADAGLRVLRNEVQVIADLQFVGLTDFWSPELGRYAAQRLVPHSWPDGTRVVEQTPPGGRDAGATLRTRAPGRPTIVLVHNPDVQDLPIWDGVRAWSLRVVRGGQVKPPFLLRQILPVYNKRYIAGEYPDRPGAHAVHQPRAGSSRAGRLNARPELTLFTLHRAPDQPDEVA